MQLPNFLSVFTGMFLILNIANAQETNFKLDEFKTTDYDRSKLDLQLDLYQSFNSRNYKYVGYNNDRDSDDEYLRLNFNGRLSFLKNLSERKKISSFGGDLYLYENISHISNEDQSYFNDKNTEQIFKSNSAEAKLNGFYDSDFYYSEKNKNFITYGGELNWHMDYTDRFEEDDSVIVDFNVFNPYRNINVSAYIGHGHGRIEYVEDAVEAIYILNELIESGYLVRDLFENDIKQLADRITLLNNERYYDFRLFRKKTIKELAALLVHEGLIDENNVDVYNTIADYHYYANMHVRQSGQRLKYFLSPFLDKRNIMQNEYDRHDSNTGISAAVSYVNFKSINVKWQRDFGINLSASKYKGSSEYIYKTRDNTKSEHDVMEYNGYVYYNIGYYPTTRSYLNISSSIRSRFVSDDFQTETELESSARLSFGGYYYFSERLRFNANLNFNYYLTDYSKSKESSINYITRERNEFYQNLSATLTYFIF
ncbi:MAG: hypothetical protein PF436_11535 [Prolixibacteraceae bacterium]|jgi:hypothetical protein|nr:hypothetical protein [Prolixibacteraceae bacterium]